MKHWRLQIGMLLVILGFLLSGCQEKKQVLSEQEYQIYYLNPAMTKLVPHLYQTSQTDPERLISELMEQFLAVPKDLDSQVALPSDKVGYLGYWKEEMVLYLYFDNNYTSKAAMNATREVLCRAALTKTLTQIEGVDYIYIYTGDQPLLDLNGSPVGMLCAADFVESVSDVNAFEKKEITLFFTDETGETLVEEKQEVIHNVNTSMEKLIVEQLLKGPEQVDHYPTLPKDLKLLNLSVTENICYINFDAAFLNNSMEVKDYIPIYSIVNSLTLLPSVNRVQISINGAQDVLFRETISLNQPFVRNLEIGGIKN